MHANQLGALIIDLQSKTLLPDERELLAHPLVGGVILFTRNYESRSQLTQLCQAIRATRPTPLLIMVDQEGGRVQRFIPEFTRLPAVAIYGEQYHAHPQNALQQSQDAGYLMATELLTTGIDLSLAPVLDVNRGLNSVVGDRAFHTDPQIVFLLAQAFMQGMRTAGMAAVGKHFPGHGSVTLDSHVALPVDERPLQAITDYDLIPFTQMIHYGIPAIMTSHIVFPQIDNLPVGFSRKWLHDILRQQLKFSGVIISDDLNMEGANISTHYADRVLAARAAGCDFVLLCNQRKGVIETIDQVPSSVHRVTEEKWRPLQAKLRKVTNHETN